MPFVKDFLKQRELVKKLDTHSIGQMEVADLKGSRRLQPGLYDFALQSFVDWRTRTGASRDVHVVSAACAARFVTFSLQKGPPGSGTRGKKRSWFGEVRPAFASLVKLSYFPSPLKEIFRRRYSGLHYLSTLGVHACWSYPDSNRSKGH